MRCGTKNRMGKRERDFGVKRELKIRQKRMNGNKALAFNHLMSGDFEVSQRDAHHFHCQVLSMGLEKREREYMG